MPRVVMTNANVAALLSMAAMQYLTIVSIADLKQAGNLVELLVKK
jgi:hypothetical protein